MRSLCSNTLLLPVSSGVAPQDDLPTLMAKAKEFIAEQDVESALRCYEKAYSIEPSEKIARRLERMRVRTILYHVLSLVLASD